MRILITGANGYIGSNLVKYLLNFKKYEVFALVRKYSKLGLLNNVCGKIAVIKTSSSASAIHAAISKSKPDVVVHLAALSLVEHSLEQVKPLILSNVLFPALLAEAMLRNRVFCLVNTGSFWEYMRGTREYTPVNLYAATKIAAENILRYYADASNLRYITLKLFGVYGPNDPRKKIFSLFKKSLTVNRPVNLSPGQQILDLVYIEDVIAAYERAIQYVYKKRDSKPEFFFIGSGEGIKLRKIAQTFEQCIGKSLNIKWGGSPYRKREIMCSKADIRQSKAKLNWEPKYNLKTGITKMLKLENLGC